MIYMFGMAVVVMLWWISIGLDRIEKHLSRIAENTKGQEVSTDMMREDVAMIRDSSQIAANGVASRYEKLGY